MPSYQYRNSNCRDKMISWSSYLHNGISYTGKMTLILNQSSVMPSHILCLQWFPSMVSSIRIPIVEIRGSYDNIIHTMGFPILVRWHINFVSECSSAQSYPLPPMVCIAHCGRHFPDDIFKRIILKKNVWIPIKISLKFVLEGLINHIPALVR